MVASHGKLRVLLLDEEIVQFLLLRELIAQADAVVIHAEADDDGAVALKERPAPLVLALGSHLAVFVLIVQGHGQFVVAVADVAGLAPYGLPGLVERTLTGIHDAEAFHQVRLFHAHRGMLVLGQFQSEVRGFHHGLPLVGHFIRRPSVVGERER